MWTSPDIYRLEPQGKEIVRTWLYYHAEGAHLFDQPGFKSVWIDGLGMDPWGRKMSKSWGNGIDADSVLDCGLSEDWIKYEDLMGNQ